MRKYCILLALAFFLQACSAKFVSSNHAFRLQSSRYCSLLHISHDFTPVPGPKPYLGIYLSSRQTEVSLPSCDEKFFPEVAGVIRGTPADDAGFIEKDVVLRIDDTPVCGDAGTVLPMFRRKIEESEIGSVVKVDILRQTRELSLEVRPGKTPFHERPGSRHEGKETCDGPQSVLETTLQEQNAYPLFRNILANLNRYSNAVHNPGFIQEETSDLPQLKEMTSLMRHPAAAGKVADRLARYITEPLYRNDWTLEDVVRRSADLIDVEISESKTPERTDFTGMVKAVEAVKKEVDEVFERFSPEEHAMFREYLLTQGDEAASNFMIERSSGIDAQKLLSAFSPLLPFFSQKNLALLKKDLLERFGESEKSILAEIMSPAGRIIVGGSGPNVYREDAALILDLGGDDLYLNNAGGSRPGIPVSVVVDWEGNDRYFSRENFSQGSGILGGGFLIDLGGDDTFISLDGSQGAGFWGMGILYHGDGSTVYQGRHLAQGVGQFGIGMNIHKKGDTLYYCSLKGQGLGLFAGAGIVINGAGNDHYQLGGSQPDFRDPSKSTVSMGQGFGNGIRPESGRKGAPGGIGILIDEEGNDTYVADYFAQGSSYYYSLGILNDVSGNDRYIAGRYAQGAGIHSSVGVLLDSSGDDYYFASFGVAQGMGHDFGVGFLEDGSGDDNYYGGRLVQGAATNGSVGIFMDLGGNDSLSREEKGGPYADADDGIGIMVAADPFESTLRMKLGIRK